MTTKIQQVKDALNDGPHTLPEIKEKTGLGTNIVGVYLSILQKRGQVKASGVRGSFSYALVSTGGGEATSAVPAEQSGTGLQTGDAGGNNGEASGDATWPGAGAADAVGTETV